MRHLLFLLFLLPNLVVAQQMNNARLDSLFKASLPEGYVEGQLGRWTLTLDATPMLCLTDENHNRMRIITPVKAVGDATPEEILACMEANFHTALDVKYAIADEVIWVAFIHPLGALTDEQLYDAMAQVRSAALTFGSTYTSTDLVFPRGDEEPAKETEPKKRTKRL